MKRMPSRWLAVLAIGLLVLLCGCLGCGKTTKPRVDPPPLTQADADDLVQMVAMMTGSDRGGWLVDIQSTLASMPLPAPPARGQRFERLFAASPEGKHRFGIMTRDTIVTVGGVQYTFHYYYTDTHGDSADFWADSVVQIDGTSEATGPIVADTTFNGFLRHLGDPISASSFEPESTLIDFTGSGDDSLFVTFTPHFRGGKRFFSLTSYTDYDVYVQRNPATNQFPLQGESSIFMFADRLRTANPDDVETTLEAQVTFFFDGTQTPTVAISNDIDVVAQFRYKVDLKTGLIIQRVQ